MHTRLRSFLATFAILAAAATLTACSSEEVDVVDETTVEQAISTYHIRMYYSDANMSQLVGEHSNLCTSVVNWGPRTQWVYYESGNCEYHPPHGWNPTDGWCDCCSAALRDTTAPPWPPRSTSSCLSRPPTSSTIGFALGSGTM
jgi:hypothetical protein